MPLRLLRNSFWSAFVLALASVQASAIPPTAQGNVHWQANDPGTLAMEGIGKGTAAINGSWQFQTGDSLAWATPDFDDSHWGQITADAPWGAQPGFAGYTGYAWYRRHIAVSATGSNPELALLIKHIDDAYELYWNGVLIGRNGNFPPHSAWYNDQAAQTFGLGRTGPGVLTGVLAVRVWKAPLVSYDSGEQGGFASPPLLGSPEAITAYKAQLDYQWLRRRQVTFALDCLYALVALVSLLAWLRGRSQWFLLWMAGFSLAPLCILFLDGLRFLIPFDISLGLQQPLYSLEDISLWFILLWILELTEVRSLTRFTWIVAAINLGSTTLDGLVAALALNSSASKAAQLVDAILTAVLTVTEILPLILIVVAVFRRRHLAPARWLVALAAFLTVMVSVIQVTSSQGSRFTHWTLAQTISAPIFTINGNPISPYTVCQTLLVFALLYAFYRYFAETGHRRTTLEREFQNARELQKVLIPETLPPVPGFTLTGAYRPAQEVGGDFFQVIPLEGGSTLILLGDVSGKGLKAAMAVALIVGALRALAQGLADAVQLNPAQLLEELNRTIHGRLQGGFATCVALRFDSDGNCVLSSAGHPSPFVNGEELTMPGSLPLGLIDNATYEESAIALGIGDQLALYTDGLLEARSPSGELYSFERLRTLFASRPTAERATEAAVAFGQDDDITVLTLTRRPHYFQELLSPSYPVSADQTIRLYPPVKA